MSEIKTKGGESLMQSSLSGPLAEAVDIFHRSSLGEALTLENFHKLLQTSVNTTFPDNYRIRMLTCVVENAHNFPDSMGDTIQALLTILCEPSGNPRESAVRSIPWLCRTIKIDETRSRVVCELSDVLLQLCHTLITGPMEEAARTALNELLVLDSKAVVSKLFVWISDHRVDELDATVCAEEKEFATTKLKEILSAKSECLSPEAIQDLGDILKDKIRTVATPRDIRSVFKIFRSMKGFDDRQCARVLTTFLSECVEPNNSNATKECVCTPLQIITTLILSSPSAARRLDSQLVSSFVVQVCTNQLYQKEISLWQCAATMGDLISEECATTILPSIVTVLLQQLHETDSGMPKYLSFIEALLGLFTRCVRKVPTALLKIIEQKNTDGSESQKLFQSCISFLTALEQTITDEMIFAAKKHVIAHLETDVDFVAGEAPVCIASLKSYLIALTATTLPKLPNPLPPLSWEEPWIMATVTSPISPKRPRQH